MHKYGAGTVYQLPNGRWAGQWSAGRDEYGQRVRGTVTAETEAGAWKALAAARGRSSSTRRRRGGETVGAFLERWLADVVKPTKRERTYWGYRQIVEQHLVPEFGDRPLVALTRREVQAWVNRQTCAPMTTRHRLDCLRGALSRAVRWGVLESNPAKDIDLPAVVRRQVRAVSADDARAILLSVEGTALAAPVTVALYTGLRQGELLGLRWEDVNLGTHTNITGPRTRSGHGREGAGRALAAGGEAAGAGVRQGEAVAVGRVPGDDHRTSQAVAQAVGGSLTVTHALARLPGARGIRYVLTEPKSATSRRTVPLAAPAAAVLAARRREALTGAGNPHNLVFANADGTPMDGTRLTKDFQAALKAAGLPAMTWHDLRHGFVTLMLASGTDIAIVSKMAGHSGIAVTVDIYGHLAPETKQAAIDKMAARMAETG